MKLKFLGTGTSQGVPVIGSDHPVCLSSNPKDKRLRCSALITTDFQQKILIDCGPDFRQQMLQNNENHIDAVLLTHEHNDHIIGLDDLRPIIFKNKKNTPIYSLERTAEELKVRFPYAFSEEKYPGAPSFDLHIIEKEFFIENTLITPINITHNQLPILGYKIKNLAYITDASAIPLEEKNKLKNLNFLIVNCLRKESPHPAHFILPDILNLVEELKPQKTYLTHLSHLIGFHEETEAELPEHISLAYDGLEIDF
ncbi:MAG: MBL fold metallo-hydrolase [Flavobacteriaceae bacterium]|nr:MBL fold metallo-hydrolase [Flavobacteriaceae bacterium]